MTNSSVLFVKLNQQNHIMEIKMNKYTKYIVNVLAVVSLVALSACGQKNVFKKQITTHGYQFNEETVQLVPEGSSREQVLLSLGTPNTTQIQQDGTETFYYISQTKSRATAFLQPKITDQKIMAVYLGEDDTVSRIAYYGLEDGKVFDFISRVTPSGGKELDFITQLLGAASTVVNPFGG